MNKIKLYKDKNKLLLFFGVFVFALLFLILKVSFLNTDTKISINSTNQNLATGLTQDEYLKIRDRYLNILNTKDPRVALENLREEIKTNDKLSRSCHEIVHSLGHAAYEKYSGFAEALKFQNELCNSGYLHGIIESHFSLSNNIFNTLSTICKDYKDNTFVGWECYHGVGHGLMFYTENDLNKSISLCESYNNSSKTSSCINGVFMENFNTNQKIHPSKFLDSANPFYPCFEQKANHKTDCYTYAPTYFLSLNKNDYLNALSWCKTSEKGFEETCSFGVGSQMIKENINNPKLVESFCMKADKNLISPCIAGMINLYINHYGSINEAESLCEKLEEKNKTTCKKTIDSMRSLF